MRASYLANLSKTKKTDIVVEFDDYIENEINPRMYWPLDETTGTTFSDSGDGLNDLQSVADASDFNIAPSTPHITGANQAKQIDTLTNHSLNVIGNDTDAGTLYNSFDSLLFQIKRSVDPQVDTTVLSYTNNGQVEQYKIVSGSSVVMTIKNGFGDLVDLTIIPDTNFMLDEWAFYAIVYDNVRGFLIYVNGILRSTFDDGLAGGVGGNFKVGGDISPLVASVDLAVDNILVVGDSLSELQVREAYSVWKFGYSSQDEVFVGESSEQNAIALPESTHNIGGLSTRTVIGKDQKFIAYKLIGDSDSSVEITIIEGTAGYGDRLNLYIYSGIIGGAYTLQETYLKINVPDSNQFTIDNYIFNYTLPAVGSEAFLVFECTGSANTKAIQFKTIIGSVWANGGSQEHIISNLVDTGTRFSHNATLAKTTKDIIIAPIPRYDGLLGNEENVGEVRVFVLNAGTWSFDQLISSISGNAFDRFGFSIAVSGDGEKLIIMRADDNGTLSQQVAYYYSRASGSYVLEQSITLQNFANAYDWICSISEDGNNVVFSSSSSGAFGTDVNKYESYVYSGVTDTYSLNIYESSLSGSFFDYVKEMVSFAGNGVCVLHGDLHVFDDNGIGGHTLRSSFNSGTGGFESARGIFDVSDDGNTICTVSPSSYKIFQWDGTNYLEVYNHTLPAGISPEVCGISADGNISAMINSTGTHITIIENKGGFEETLFLELHTPHKPSTGYGDGLNISHDGSIIVIGDAGWQTDPLDINTDIGRITILSPV